MAPMAPHALGMRMGPMPPVDHKRKSVGREVGEFRKHLWSSGTGIAICWAINLMTSPDFAWAVFPTIGMGMGILGHASRVKGRGLSWAQLIGRQPVPELDADEVSRLGPDGIAATLATPDVLQGPYGAAVRRAASDSIAIADVLKRLSKTERGMIPDVAPTAQALTDRVGALATTLHRLDTDLSGASLDALEERLARVRAEPESADQARRLMLLERQQSTLQELKERRGVLVGQLESAQLALGNLKLDLYKLRSAGAAAGLDDVHSATQQARAVSRDIGHAVDAAREVEGL